jgi:hypothetical protein
VYLPLVPVGLVLAAAGLTSVIDLFAQKLSQHLKLPVAVLAAVAPLMTLNPNLQSWMPVDWKAVTPVIRSEMPGNVYINYPAGQSYVIRYYYFPEIGVEIMNRAPKGHSAMFAQVAEPLKISGINLQTRGETDISIPEKLRQSNNLIAEVNVDMYSLERVGENYAEKDDTRGIYLAFIGPAQADRVTWISKELRRNDEPGKWLLLNGFLRGKYARASNYTEMYASAFVAENPKLTPAQMSRISKIENNLIRFYRLTDFSNKRPPIP